MKKLYKVLLLSLAFVTADVYAALIDGTMVVGGAYDATGGLDLSDATDLTLDTVYANGGTDDILLTFNLLTPEGTGGSASIDSFAPVSDFLTIGGWTLGLSSLNIIDQTASVLNLSGTGVLSGNSFDTTDVVWSFSSQSTTSYSMTITTVPVPAAIWLFGSGLVGLVAVSRRKA